MSSGFQGRCSALSGQVLQCSGPAGHPYRAATASKDLFRSIILYIRIYCSEMCFTSCVYMILVHGYLIIHMCIVRMKHDSIGRCVTYLVNFYMSSLSLCVFVVVELVRHVHRVPGAAPSSAALPAQPVPAACLSGRATQALDPLPARRSVGTQRWYACLTPSYTHLSLE